MSLTKIKNQKSKIKINFAGFSLIEIMVVVSLLGLISAIASGFLFSSLSSSSKAEVAKEVKQNGNFALLLMERMITNAYSLQTCDTSSITIISSDGGSTTFKCEEDRIASESGSLGKVYLTGTNVLVSECAFACQKTAGKGAVVTLKFKVSQALTSDRPTEKSSLDFETMVNVRNF